jgi:hypothetical protein
MMRQDAAFAAPVSKCVQLALFAIKISSPETKKKL